MKGAPRFRPTSERRLIERPHDAFNQHPQPTHHRYCNGREVEHSEQAGTHDHSSLTAPSRIYLNRGRNGPERCALTTERHCFESTTCRTCEQPAAWLLTAQPEPETDIVPQEPCSRSEDCGTINQIGRITGHGPASGLRRSLPGAAGGKSASRIQRAARRFATGGSPSGWRGRNPARSGCGFLRSSL